MKFEDLFLEIGGFGRFQILVLFILCLPRINLPMHFLLHNFLAATPHHHCAIPPREAFENLTTEEVLLISIPRDPDGTFRSCEMFSQPQFQLLLNSSLQPENSSIIQHCQHGWVYDHSQFISTIATQKWPKSQEALGKGMNWSDRRGMLGLEMPVLGVPVRAEPSLNLPTTTTPAFGSTEVRGHQVCPSLLHCFREKGTEHPWWERERRFPATQMLSTEPRDAAPTVHEQQDRAFCGALCSHCKKGCSRSGLGREAWGQVDD
uniref:Uncharacterized protein n=1 Tax=Melopsittacus undulatus TaxID=13146 RepID=A0A8C6JRV7_MELUD